MRYSFACVLGVFMALAAGPTLAGDPAAGKAKSQICVGCHGVNGISAIPTYPNLAGSRFFQATDHIHQCGFATTRGTDHSCEFPLLKAEIDSINGVHRDFRVVIGFCQILNFYDAHL